MKVGIVGSESAKFTPLGEERAKLYIRYILSQPGVTEVISGRCHLGGIDIWAVEIGRQLGLICTEFPPVTLSWNDGYKPRNLKIADNSDKIYCLTVDQYPINYIGMRFEACYHCLNNANVLTPPPHIKSGGCWTMWKAHKKGKKIQLYVVNNY